jgi:hypothetical protein
MISRDIKTTFSNKTLNPSSTDPKEIFSGFSEGQDP